MFKHRHPHFAITEIPCNRQGGLFHVLPFVAFARQHVLRAADGVGNQCHLSQNSSRFWRNPVRRSYTKEAHCCTPLRMLCASLSIRENLNLCCDPLDIFSDAD